jgi:diaminopimelate epimerase
MMKQTALRFHKMHGAGNDFVVLDLRAAQSLPALDVIRAMGNRHTGIGFDQLLTIENTEQHDCMARYRIFNADGSSAQQCGNGARCVAAWLKKFAVISAPQFVLDSPAGKIAVRCLENEWYALEMGVPEFIPARIPFHTERVAESYQIKIEDTPIEFLPVSMGNPHAVIEVVEIESAPVERIGKALQASAEFPESVNVGFAQILSSQHIRLRVYERGAGETLACGSGACAAVAALIKRGKLSSQVRVSLPGGDLEIAWPDQASAIVMSGPAAFVYEGVYQA